MKKVIFSLLVLSCFFTSCSGVDPVVWNTNIVSVYNKTLDDIEDFQDLISLETIGDQTVNIHITEKGNRAIADLEQTIKQILEGEIPSGAEEYQQSVITMLESVKEQITVGLQFTQFTEDTTEAVVDEYADKYDVLSIATAQKVDAFIVAQKLFADSEGIDLK